jgi:glycosyltransferase involved in cell wall biosynthesis
MKILHIVAGVFPGSGVAEVVAGLSPAVKVLGHDVMIVSLAGPMAASIEKAQSMGVRLVRFIPSQPRFLCFSWGMLLGLGKMVKNADVVHVHSNWTFPVWWGAWLALRHQKTLVMSPHGCLDPVRLKHSGWKKALVGWIDRWLLRRASVIHATCEAENAWIQAFLKFETGNLKLGEALRSDRPKIVVIPNGVGIPAPGRNPPPGRGSPKLGSALL